MRSGRFMFQAVRVWSLAGLDEWLAGYARAGREQLINLESEVERDSSSY